MSLQERIDSLKEKHHSLEQALQNESNRPHPDESEVMELKKQKLAIKDQLAEIVPH